MTCQINLKYLKHLQRNEKVNNAEVLGTNSKHKKPQKYTLNVYCEIKAARLDSLHEILIESQREKKINKKKQYWKT